MRVGGSTHRAFVETAWSHQSKTLSTPRRCRSGPGAIPVALAIRSHHPTDNFTVHVMLVDGMGLLGSFAIALWPPLSPHDGVGAGARGGICSLRTEGSP
jgi:hypothetical protein